MVRHVLFLRRWLVLTPLELLSLVCIQPVIPVNRVFTQETQVGLPTDHLIAVLDDEAALLGSEVILAPQEVITKEEV